MQVLITLLVKVVSVHPNIQLANVRLYFDCKFSGPVLPAYCVLSLQEEDTSLLNVTPDGHVLQVCWHHLHLLIRLRKQQTQ